MFFVLQGKSIRNQIIFSNETHGVLFYFLRGIEEKKSEKLYYIAKENSILYSQKSNRRTDILDVKLAATSKTEM